VTKSRDEGFERLLIEKRYSLYRLRPEVAPFDKRRLNVALTGSVPQAQRPS